MLFKVIKVDPDGSGIEFKGHLGATIFSAKRCCKNCVCIFGKLDAVDGIEIGPFIPGELEPLDAEAESLLNEIINE